MLDGCTIDSSYGSIRTRPASISARMSLSERSTPRGYARRAERPQPDVSARLVPVAYCLSVTAPAVLPLQPRPLRLPLLPLLPLLIADGHHAPEPRTTRAPKQPPGAEPLGLLHRERSGAEHVPIGTTDDGALHQVQESLPQEPRLAAAHLTTKATVRDQRDGPPGGTPVPPGPSFAPPPYAPTPFPRSRIPSLKRPQAPRRNRRRPDMR